MWRSLVAYTPGGRGVAGSNPVIPTSTKSDAKASLFLFLKPAQRHFESGEQKQEKLQALAVLFVFPGPDVIRII